VSPRLRIALWVGVALVVGVMILSTWADRREARDSPLRQAEEVRDVVREARAGWEACLDTLDVVERRFRTQAEETERLQARIHRLEAMDPRGVPADSYEVYLEVVDRFNATVQGWEGRLAALRAREAACQDLLEARNELADSLRALLEDAGYLPDTLAPLQPEDGSP
jgi:DNA repair ATPase RecN